MKSESSWRLRAVGLGLLTVALVLSVAAAEFFVRLRYPELGIPVRKIKLFTEYDPLLGWRKIPSFRGVHANGVVEVINSKAVRGPEYPYEKPPGQYRILILGDSHAEGYRVQFDELFSEELERRLSGNLAREIEVINAGTGGYSTDQELLYFRTEGIRYSPDLTILLFYYNDLKYNLLDHYWRGPKPLFQFDADGKLVLHSVPGPNSAPATRRGSRRGRAEAFQLTDPKTWYVPRLVSFGLSVAGRNFSRAFGKSLLESDDAAESAELASEGDGVPGAEDSLRLHRSMTAEMWRMAAALLAEVERESRSINSRFLIFYVPQRADVYANVNKDAGDVKIQTRRDAVGWNLGVIAARESLDLLDPLAEMRRVAARELASGVMLYPPDDRHWSAAGHAVAGEILAAHLLAECDSYGLCEDR